MTTLKLLIVRWLLTKSNLPPPITTMNYLYENSSLENIIQRRLFKTLNLKISVRSLTYNWKHHATFVSFILIRDRKVREKLHSNSIRFDWSYIRFDWFDWLFENLKSIRFDSIQVIFDSIRFGIVPKIYNSESIRFDETYIRFDSIRFRRGTKNMLCILTDYGFF